MKLFLYLACALAAGISAAKPLPPIGQRIYIMDEKASSQPPRIEDSTKGVAAGAKVMRDPLRLDSRHIVNEPATALVPPSSPASRLKFEPVSVNGRYMVPRVSFHRPALEIKRAEAPVPQAHKKRIKESEDLLKDFGW